MKKKGVISLEMIIVFITVVMIALIAAFLFIKATNSAKEATYAVDRSAKGRIINRIKVISIVAVANLSTSKITGFELLIKPDYESGSVDLKETGFVFSQANATGNARYFALDDPSLCSFENLEAMTEFCFIPLMGDSNAVMEEDEFGRILYKMDESGALSPRQPFEIHIVPPDCAVASIDRKAPNTITKERITYEQ